jgi:hypothetical protein
MDPYSGVAHFYIENTGTTKFNTVILELVRQLVQHCATQIPWRLSNVYEKLRPNAPNLQHAMTLLRSFTLAREGLVYQDTFLVLDGIDGLADASDTRFMGKIFKDLTGPMFKGCHLLLSMKNDYYKTLRATNILFDGNHSAISVGPDTFPLVYERHSRLLLQRRGYNVPLPAQRFYIFVRR